MNLKPLDDRIVVKPNEAETADRVGPRDPRHRQGEAPAGLGPRRRPRQALRHDSGELIPLDIKVGDTVLYSKYGGTEVDDRRRRSARPQQP